MANMDFCDKHNMVAFLQKPTGSEEFHQIVDFLAGSHIRYALTTNPTIYVSLIEQFWQTVTVDTVNDGEQQLTVTVDGQTIAITEASVRRHLQLADADGISSLPNTEIFDQLTLMGYVSNDDKLTFQKGLLSFRYWNVIDIDVVEAVLQFFSSSKFPRGCNASFITLIPKMQDAKVVKDFCPISLIGSMHKIITKILANRLSMDYLDDVLNKFGFGVKWRGWIQGCLNSAMGSILVNGSPTSEFKFFKGLKQGDPLSHFLFILIMESLHLSFKNVLDASIFKGIDVNESLTLSHLFYADDAVFVGK
ncbi:RNA-directed DNA polymerase, eukaryota [Tanacetum coccineum]